MQDFMYTALSKIKVPHNSPVFCSLYSFWMLPETSALTFDTSWTRSVLICLWLLWCAITGRGQIDRKSGLSEPAWQSLLVGKIFVYSICSSSAIKYETPRYGVSPGQMVGHEVERLLWGTKPLSLRVHKCLERSVWKGGQREPPSAAAKALRWLRSIPIFL